MLKNSKTTIALAFASLLAVGATAMAAPSAHRADKAQWTESQAQSVQSADEVLFDRAKGGID